MTQIIGPNVVGQVSNKNGQGSDVQTFMNFLSAPASQIPLNSNFLVVLETIPGIYQSDTQFPVGFENHWRVDNTRQVIMSSLQATAQTPLGGQVCLWCQGFSVPGETINTSRPNNATGGPTGGLLTGVVTQERQTYGNLELAILETNASFIDFVIRPWIALVGHYGLISRSPSSTQNVKTTITGVLFDKNNANAIRKIFTFRGACPVSIGNTDYATGLDYMEPQKVSFIFNTYSVEEPSSGSSW